MSAPNPIANAAAFTPGERDYIRRELDMFFSTLPSVAEGFYLQTWRGGPQSGQPKVPLAAAGLLERGLMRLDTTGRQPRLFFTEPVVAAQAAGAAVLLVGVVLAQRAQAASEKAQKQTGPEMSPDPSKA